MTAEQATKLNESAINRALVFAYASLIKFLHDTNFNVDQDTIHFESIKQKDNAPEQWEVVFSYKQTQGDKTKTAITAFDAIYGNKTVYQRVIVNPDTEEVIAVEKID